MGTFTGHRGRSALVGLAAALAAGAATAFVATGASGGSMPAANPTDARDAAMKVITRTIAPKPTTTRGFTASRRSRSGRRRSTWSYRASPPSPAAAPSR